MKITEAGEMKKGEYRIVPMLDGKVHLRLHPVEFVMEPENADAAAKSMILAARIARVIQEELKHVPADFHTDAQVEMHLRGRLADIEHSLQCTHAGRAPDVETVRAYLSEGITGNHSAAHAASEAFNRLHP